MKKMMKRIASIAAVMAVSAQCLWVVAAEVPVRLAVRILQLHWMERL